MGSFKPVSKERAEEIRNAIKSSRSLSDGLGFDRETGDFVGTDSLKSADPDRVSMIGKFDTHFRS